MTPKKKTHSTKRKQEHSFMENVKLFLSGKSEHQKRTTKVFWGKKFTFLIILFLLYSFILISNWDNVVFRIVTINDPYALSVALVFTLFMFAIFFLNTKFKQFFFGKYSILKQIPFFFGLLYGSFFLWRFLI